MDKAMFSHYRLAQGIQLAWLSLGVSVLGLEKLGSGGQPEVCSEEHLKAAGFAINVVSK